MRKAVFIAALAAALAGSCLVYAQGAPSQQAGPDPRMSFFVTGESMGDGGNYGGLAGADRQCQALAARVGAGGRTWRAYLSAQKRPGQPAVNARDRIGTGPWYNFKGEMVARDNAHLHGDTLELARLGNNVNKLTALTEKGQIVPGLGDYPNPRSRDWEYMRTTFLSNRHEIITGTRPDGRTYNTDVDYTCRNWTSNEPGTSGMVQRNNDIGVATIAGMSDKNGGGNGHWSSAHPTGGCSQQNFARLHGAGYFYCFAID